jgi:two-component system cell cycle sensor histidine kinase/response regulator CckA
VAPSRDRRRPLDGRDDGRRSRHLLVRICRLSRWPIRAYFLVLVLLFVFAAGGAAVYVRGQADRDAKVHALNDARFAAKTASKQLGTYVSLVGASVKGLAENPRISQTFVHPAGCTLSFSGLGGPDRGHIDIIAPDGTVACSSRTPATGGHLSGYRGETWIRRALAGPFFRAPVVDRATGAKVAITAVPIPGGTGVIAAFADLESVGRELAAQYGGGHPVEFLVTSKDGRTVIARSISARHWIGASAPPSLLSSEVERRDLDGTTRIYAMSQLPGVGWRFYAGEDRGVVLASAAHLADRQLAIILFGLVAFLFAAWLVYLNLVRPIRRLRATLRKSRDAVRPKQVPTAGPAEIRGLAEDINGLIDSVDRELGERERAEEAAQTSERNYRLLFQSNPNPMWVFDVETLRFLTVNEAAIRQYGYSRDEFLTMTIEDIRPPEDIPLLHTIVGRDSATDARGFAPAAIWRHRRKDGSVIHVEVTSHTHEFEGVAARVVLALDVTQLRESEARYRDLFENATDLIATTDLDGRLTDANRAFVDAVGYSLDELLGKPLSELVPPESQQKLQDARTSKLSSGLHATVYEHELLAKDGNLIQVEVSSRVTEAHGQPSGIEAICRDVSDRKRLEDQLRQSQRLEAIGQLAGGVAHDFNNLLTVISGYTEVLLSSNGNGAHRELSQIAGASARAAALTRQLLAFSRRQVLQPRVIDVNEVIGNLAPMVERLIGEDLELVTALDPRLHHVVADPGQVEQVLMNLAVNARDAMPAGGKLTIETGNATLDEHYAASHQDAKAGPHAVLAVSDTGVGMDAATLERVFEPFFTTKPLGSGTGLGLATVHGIVNQSGGNIWVYSEPGKGTTFKIYFPAVNAELTEEAILGPAVAPTGAETILVVEDEPSLRSLIAEMLSGNGYRVITAATPLEALELVEQEEGIDLLLTDLIMPHLGGRDLAARVTELRPRISVLFMSGYADEAANRSGALGPGAPYLEKPFSAYELATRIRSILDASPPLALVP